MTESTQHLPALVQALAPTVNKYGYFGVGGLILLEDFGVPVPGETILITAAIFAGTGQLNIFLVVLVAFVAAIIGDSIGFAIGNYGGRRLIDRFGKYILLTSERMNKAEGFFARNGGKVVVIARFVEGLRQANGIIAGISEMKWPRFVAFNALGAALWVGLWSSVGYFGGNHIDTLHKYEGYFSAALGIAIVAVVVYTIIKHRRKVIS